MGVRVVSRSTNQPPSGGEGTEFLDDTREQRETTVDGYTYHWGINEKRNFLDEGVGVAHAAFNGGATIVQEDAIPFGDSRF